MRNDVKIVINGQIDNDTKVGFTYPDPFNPANTSDRDEWLRSVTDPRDARVFRCEELYVIWKNDYGNYYAIVVPNKSDSRGGMLMLTLFTGHSVSKSGRTILQVLRELRELLIIQKRHNDRGEINRILSMLDGSLKQDIVPYRPKQISTKLAYRSYSNDSELEKIFQNPDQSEYYSFKKIFIVPQGCLSPSLPYDFERITTPVRVIYTISEPSPQGVKIDKTSLPHGDILTITYSKQGYVPEKRQELLDGSDNHTYVHFNGNEFTVFDAERAGIRFKRGIKIECLSEEGMPIGRFGIRDGGKQFEYDKDKGISFAGDNGSYQIDVIAYGYVNCRVTITEDDFNRGKKQVRLERKKVPMSVSYVTADGKVGRDRVLINEDSPLRPILEEMSKQRIPLNVEKRAQQSVGSTALDTPSNKPWDKMKWSLIITGVVIILYALFCWSEKKPFGWPFAKERTEVSKGSGAPQIDPRAEENPTDVETQKEREDVDWMKDNDKWNKQNIKSQKYQTLLDYISKGQIGEIISNQPWFKESPVNNYWKQCEELIGKMDEDLKTEASEELKSLSKGNKAIDVQKLFNSLNVLLKSTQSESGGSIGQQTPESKKGNNDQSKKNATKPEGKKNSSIQERNGRETSGHKN